MRAALIHAYGDADVLTVDDAHPRPELRPNDVLIEVHATAINPIDWKMREGTQKLAVRRPFPLILGMDVSGVVAEVGPDVTRFKPGDAVYSSPTFTRQGTYAEFVAIDASEVALKPTAMTHIEAASIPLVGLTAWQALVTAADLKADERVFIEGGSGGVGSFAVQLAAALGAHVATTCSGRNVDWVRELGAHEVIDYTTTPFEDVLQDQDVALHAMDGTADRIRSIMRSGGRLTSINAGLYPRVQAHGAVVGAALTGLDMASFYISSRICHGVRMFNVVRKPLGADLEAITAHIDQKRIRAIVDRVYPLEAIREAHRYSASHRARGKIVIAVHPDTHGAITHTEDTP